VYWFYGTTALALNELGVDDVDRRMSVRTTKTSKAGRVILGCLKGLSLQNMLIAMGILWSLCTYRHKTGEKLQLYFGLCAAVAAIHVLLNVNFDTGFRRLVIAVLVIVMSSLDLFLDTISVTTGPGSHKNYWEGYM
jgi:uncharacterized membrane protein